LIDTTSLNIVLKSIIKSIFKKHIRTVVVTVNAIVLLSFLRILYDLMW